jgi:hypothetical protein
MRLLIAFVVWIVAIAGAAEVSTVVAQSIHANASSATPSGGGSTGGGSTSGSGSTSGGGSVGASVDPSSVKATDPQSLFRASNFARALATARTNLGPGAKLSMVVIYPGYASLTAVKGGSEVLVYIAVNGRFMETNTGGNPGTSPLFPLTQVKADVPASVAQRIATSAHVPESQLHYMVAEVDPSNNHFRWLVYPQTGNRVEYFEASGATGPLLELLSNSSTGLQPVR